MKHSPIPDAAAPAPVAPPLRGPDFIIGGAPKCGTTSLHFILNQHPEIALPTDEVNYFDADDPLNWPDFFDMRGGELHWLDVSDKGQAAREWYRSVYAPLAGHRLLGEDSTRYLFSPIVAQRVRDRLPDARIIFMLRDPVKRAYSQYWHDMKMMRVTAPFERALATMPQIVAGSTYAPHLRHWFEVLGRERVLVLLLEDFQRDNQGVMDRVADFIGVPRFDLAGYDQWFNRTYYPVSPTAQRAINWLAGRHVARLRYRTHMVRQFGRREYWSNKIYQNWFHRVNPLLFRSESCPPINPRTAAYLAAHLKERNDGLDDLLGRDLAAVWPSWR